MGFQNFKLRSNYISGKAKSKEKARTDSRAEIKSNKSKTRARGRTENTRTPKATKLSKSQSEDILSVALCV